PSGRGRRVEALVVVVDRHREGLLRLILPHDVVVEDALDLGRLGELTRRRRLLALELALEDVVAELDAFAADVDGRPRDEARDLVLATAAERASDRMRGCNALLHDAPLSLPP